MERIIWWWNLVYYFCVKWYTKVGDIIHIPFKFFLGMSAVQKFYKKRGIDDIEKTVKDAVKQAQIAEMYMEFFLSMVLSIPMIGLSWIINAIFDSNGIVKGVTIFIIGAFISLLLSFYPIQGFLLGKNDRYKKYFKEFDKKFKKCSKATKYVYGILSILFVLFLFSTFYWESLIAEIRHIPLVSATWFLMQM